MNHAGFQKRLGILGGGQLARMMIPYAQNLGCEVHILDPDPDCPAASLTRHITVGDFRSIDDVLDFGSEMDTVTIEIEDVSTDGLKYLRDRGVQIFPNPDLIGLIQDKGLQKEFFEKHSLPTSPFVLSKSKDDLKNKNIKYPAYQKLRRAGYDGRGVHKLNSPEDIETALVGECIIEDQIEVAHEIAFVVARSVAGQMAVYDAVEMHFESEHHILDYLAVPTTVEPEILIRAKNLALECVELLQPVGVVAVEMFVTKSGDVLINEVAPRVHNSGHHTIEACITSQFEQHIRAVLGYSLGSTELTSPAVMFNLLGADGENGHATLYGAKELLETPRAHLHWYGKSITRPKRKMGHVTVLGHSRYQAVKIATPLKSILKVGL